MSLAQARHDFDVVSRHACEVISPSQLPDGPARRAFLAMLYCLNREWDEIQAEEVLAALAEEPTDPCIKLVRK